MEFAARNMISCSTFFPHEIYLYDFALYVDNNDNHMIICTLALMMLQKSCDCPILETSAYASDSARTPGRHAQKRSGVEID